MAGSGIIRDKKQNGGDTLKTHLEVIKIKRIDRGSIIITACGRKYNCWKRKVSLAETEAEITCKTCLMVLQAQRGRVKFED
jgi:hypothetical protein